MSQSKNSKPHQPTVYAFIDSQNLNLGTNKDVLKNNKVIYHGWKLDFKKFRQYLHDKFKVSKAFLFIGYINENESLYRNLKKIGYELVYKPTVKDDEGKAKGNVDAELVLYASAIEYDNYDQAVIVSGDGDFKCLLEFLQQHHKLAKIIIPNRKSESSLLKDFQPFKVFLIREKAKLELKNHKKRET